MPTPARSACIDGTELRAPRAEIAVMVLGRLAIHKHHHQAGLGTALLRDALTRTLQVAAIAGVAALLVHALSEDAKRYYRSRGFVESPVNPMTMCWRF